MKDLSPAMVTVNMYLVLVMCEVPHLHFPHMPNLRKSPPKQAELSLHFTVKGTDIQRHSITCPR